MTVNELLNEIMQALQKKQIDGQSIVYIGATEEAPINDIKQVVIEDNTLIIEF